MIKKILRRSNGAVHVLETASKGNCQQVSFAYGKRFTCASYTTCQEKLDYWVAMQPITVFLRLLL